MPSMTHRVVDLEQATMFIIPKAQELAAESGRHEARYIWNVTAIQTAHRAGFVTLQALAEIDDLEPSIPKAEFDRNLEKATEAIRDQHPAPDIRWAARIGGVAQEMISPVQEVPEKDWRRTETLRAIGTNASLLGFAIARERGTLLGLPNSLRLARAISNAIKADQSQSTE